MASLKRRLDRMEKLLEDGKPPEKPFKILFEGEVSPEGFTALKVVFINGTK